MNNRIKRALSVVAVLLCTACALSALTCCTPGTPGTETGAPSETGSGPDTQTAVPSDTVGQDGSMTDVTASDVPSDTDAEAVTDAPVPSVSLTFVTTPGQSVPVGGIPAGSEIGDNLPDDPVREGYAFKGWYTGQDGDGDRVTVDTVVETDATYYAKWTEYTDMSKRNRVFVGGFNGITEANVTESDVAALADAGIDVIFPTWFHHTDGVYSLERSLEWLGWLEKYGVKAYVNDWELNGLLEAHAPEDECMALLSLYKDSPAYAGNYLADEPAGDRFGTLIPAVEYFEQLMPGYEMYINLLPDFAPSSAYIGGSYKAYVDSFAKDFPLSYVSQDYYPINIVGTKRRVANSYYASLYAMATSARDAGKDAWMYVYLMRDTVNAEKDYEPTLTDLRFEVGTAMAFGCSSITYYCFDCPPSYGKTDSYGALKNHERTPLFDVAAQITKEVKAYSDILPRYQWLDTYYMATSSRLASGFKKTLTAVSDAPVDLTVSVAGDADASLVIGAFDEVNGDGEAFMIVNACDLNALPEVTLNLTVPGARRVTARIGCDVTGLTEDNGVYTVTVPGGNAVFIEIER